VLAHLLPSCLYQFRHQFARLFGRLAGIDKMPTEDRPLQIAGPTGLDERKLREDVLLLENRQFGFGEREEIEDRLIVGPHSPMNADGRAAHEMEAGLAVTAAKALLDQK